MVRTFQLTKALSRMTVMDNMMLGAQNQAGENLAKCLLRPLWGGQEKEVEAKALELLDRFSLLEKRTDYAGSLSGGQRKLLEMARALMSDPKMIMLDEPMAGVNPALTQSLLGHIQSLRDDGMTVLFVEHDMHVVRHISDWVVVMAEGKIVAEGAGRVGDVQPGRHRRLPGRPPRHRPGRRRPAHRRQPREAGRGSRRGGRRARDRGGAAMTTHTQQQTAVVEAKDLVAGYLPGVNILNGCSLVAYPGEMIGIIGPNGAGKSTLLKAMFGLVKIRSGSVHLGTQDITNLRANTLVEMGVGFVPQNNNVFPSLTIEENLQMGLFLRPKKIRERLDAMWDLFPVLHERRNRSAGALSGGERQSLAMARALMMEPSVLLLDEPSAGLSPVRQDETFIRTRRINKTGVCVVMVEQNARRCLQICDRGYVLDQGRDAYTGTGRELANDPKVIELYLGTLAEDVESDDDGACRPDRTARA